MRNDDRGEVEMYLKEIAVDRQIAKRRAADDEHRREQHERTEVFQRNSALRAEERKLEELVAMLPKELKGYQGKEIAPGVFLISNPKFDERSGQWRALANVLGSLCLIQLTVKFALPEARESGK